MAPDMGLAALNLQAHSTWQRTHSMTLVLANQAEG